MRAMAKTVVSAEPPDIARASIMPARAAVFILSSRCSRVHLFKFESLEDFSRKRAVSSKHLVEVDAVDPRPPRPGRLTTRPIYDFA